VIAATESVEASRSRQRCSWWNRIGNRTRR
jgi:hypothetical protein